MMQADDRYRQFKADIAAMKLKTGTSGRDFLLQIVGGALMLLGTGAAFIVYAASLHDNDARDIASKQILAAGFLALVLVGAALFVIGALARVLRLWLLRQLYEGQAHIDQLSDAIRDGAEHGTAG